MIAGFPVNRGYGSVHASQPARQRNVRAPIIIFHCLVARRQLNGSRKRLPLATWPADRAALSVDIAEETASVP
jgi:hypothetical protein